jgi:hypothetical protein
VVAVNRFLAYAFIVIGVVLLVETAVQGATSGLPTGYLAGVVFIALGLLRRRAMRPPGSRP